MTTASPVPLFFNPNSWFNRFRNARVTKRAPSPTTFVSISRGLPNLGFILPFSKRSGQILLLTTRRSQGT